MPESFSFKGYTIEQAIEGLRSYDDGMLDSGIKDEELRSAVIDYLSKMDDDEWYRFVNLYTRNFLTDESMAKGYGFSDAMSAYNWINEHSEI